MIYFILFLNLWNIPRKIQDISKGVYIAYALVNMAEDAK